MALSLRKWLWPTSQPVSPIGSPADSFEWPTDLDYTISANTSEFVAWAQEIGERADLTWSRVRTLYIEYCCVAQRRPISDRRLQRELRHAGVEPYRASVKIKDRLLHRPTMYRIRTRKGDNHLLE